MATLSPQHYSPGTLKLFCCSIFRACVYSYPEKIRTAIINSDKAELINSPSLSTGFPILNSDEEGQQFFLRNSLMLNNEFNDKADKARH